MKTKKPELMAPASDFTGLQAALSGGADAIYFGTKELNMRATARNFEVSQISKVVEACHKLNRKAYLTLNTLVFDDELGKIKSIVSAAKKAGIDAVIFWDISLLAELKKANIPAFLSTQASIANATSAEFYQKIGVKRIVLARECSLQQIAFIKKKTGIEIEVFVHGALCTSISGRCLISHELFGKSANRGDCLQPCRREYKIQDIESEIQLRVGSDYVLSSKDLCTLPFIDKLICANIDSFKIEGRNRSPEYINTVTHAYRDAIDHYYVQDRKEYKLTKKKILKRVELVYNRGFCSGFFLDKPDASAWAKVYGSEAKQKKAYIGKVGKYYEKISVAELKLETMDLCSGDRIMVQGPKTGVIETTVGSIHHNNKLVSKANKGDYIGIKTDIKMRKNDKVFNIIS